MKGQYAVVPLGEVEARLTRLRRQGAEVLRARGQHAPDLLPWDDLGALLGLAKGSHGNFLARVRGTFATTPRWLDRMETRINEEADLLRDAAAAQPTWAR